MLIELPGILSRADALAMRDAIAAATWIDGNATSGHQSALAKRNRQLDEQDAVARAAGARVLDALSASALFVAAALPLKVYPPLFNRYDAESGDGFGDHVDSAVRVRAGSDFRIRSDLSATLFLSDPADYDGGELVVEEGSGERRVRLGAGDMILYPASTVHRVTPVTRGTRFASFFWIQSMIRDGAARGLLLELDRAVQSVAARLGGGDEAAVRLTGVYHNLLRRWAEL